MHICFIGKAQLNSFSAKTHTCGELRGCDIGKRVTLCGWLQYTRMGYFLVIRDMHGLTQVTLSSTEVSLTAQGFSHSAKNEKLLEIIYFSLFVPDNTSKYDL